MRIINFYGIINQRVDGDIVRAPASDRTSSEGVTPSNSTEQESEQNMVVRGAERT